MSRTLGSIPLDKSFPSPGQYACTVIKVTKEISRVKHTLFLKLTLSNGEVEFTDSLFLSDKSLPRLCLVAKRVCDMPDNFELPDSDVEAVSTVAQFILSTIEGKRTLVTIEENEETFIPESGPDMGRKTIKKRRRVAFMGYQKIKNEDQEIPF